jgi:hypothetical protein
MVAVVCPHGKNWIYGMAQVLETIERDETDCEKKKIIDFGKKEEFVH